MATLFFSYSHQDEPLRDRLETQLAMLRRQGIIATWHDRRIIAGEDLDHAISEHVETDDIILLLVSPDFLASDYCYDREMTRALERQRTGEAIVIPVILRPCEWQEAPFGKLLATPKDGKPVTKYADLDDAFLEVAGAIRRAAEGLSAGKARGVQPKVTTPQPAPASRLFPSPAARSSNLAIARSYTDRDRDAFRHEAFEYVANYFSNSADELRSRHPEIEATIRRVDANRFTASAYREGKAVSRATIYMGGAFGAAINYVIGETMSDSTTNEMLSVDADDQMLFLRPSGMRFTGSGRDAKLTFEGAAEHFWTMFIEPLQRLR